MAKILIVDDDPDILIVIRRLLETDGHEGVMAEDGMKALELIKLDSFDLVISDLRMPSMDGIALLREIRVLKPSLPVILVTAYASSETARESVKLGASAYIFKPFKVKELQDTVKLVLDGGSGPFRSASQ